MVYHSLCVHNKRSVALVDDRRMVGRADSAGGGVGHRGGDAVIRGPPVIEQQFPAVLSVVSALQEASRAIRYLLNIYCNRLVIGDAGT